MNSHHRPSNNNIKKAVVKNADMEDGMREDVLGLATQCMEKFTLEKDMASFMKRQMDELHGPTWHAVVGKHFGSFVTHETKHFIYFYCGSYAFLLFKSG
ncbi:Dynein light chain 1, cytoplasmic [Holothuria leucospilota]|uniref:Dynein light chain n=1 Tax=Holothuria leucospilota TaxID=206669 RepID=A0A9Q1CAI9_HOLLE|nr:Dynein light chain 1, cytoplasmic [Holothuria leucospilota]